MSSVNNNSILIAMLWMLFLSLFLFWIPVIGPVIAGVIGGKKAGGVGAAVLAAMLPALVLGGGLFFLASILSGVPVLGVVAGLGGVTFALMNVGPLLVGAVFGGFLTD